MRSAIAFPSNTTCGDMAERAGVLTTIRSACGGQASTDASAIHRIVEPCEIGLDQRLRGSARGLGQREGTSQIGLEFRLDGFLCRSSQHRNDLCTFKHTARDFGGGLQRLGKGATVVGARRVDDPSKGVGVTIDQREALLP